MISDFVTLFFKESIFFRKIACIAKYIPETHNFFPFPSFLPFLVVAQKLITFSPVSSFLEVYKTQIKPRNASLMSKEKNEESKIIKKYKICKIARKKWKIDKNNSSRKSIFEEQTIFKLIK